MKGHRLLEVVCALVALAVADARADQAAFSAKVKATAGLLGYWSFEGNYEDQSGKGNHAQAFGDTNLIKFCPGVKGGRASSAKTRRRKASSWRSRHRSAAFSMPRTSVSLSGRK